MGIFQGYGNDDSGAIGYASSQAEKYKRKFAGQHKTDFTVSLDNLAPEDAEHLASVLYKCNKMSDGKANMNDYSLTQADKELMIKLGAPKSLLDKDTNFNEISNDTENYPNLEEAITDQVNSWRMDEQDAFDCIKKWFSVHWHIAEQFEKKIRPLVHTDNDKAFSVRMAAINNYKLYSNDYSRIYGGNIREHYTPYSKDKASQYFLTCFQKGLEEAYEYRPNRVLSNLSPEDTQQFFTNKSFRESILSTHGNNHKEDVQLYKYPKHFELALDVLDINDNNGSNSYRNTNAAIIEAITRGAVFGLDIYAKNENADYKDLPPKEDYISLLSKIESQYGLDYIFKNSIKSKAGTGFIKHLSDNGRAPIAAEKLRTSPEKSAYEQILSQYDQSPYIAVDIFKLLREGKESEIAKAQDNGLKLQDANERRYIIDAVGNELSYEFTSSEKTHYYSGGIMTIIDSPEKYRYHPKEAKEAMAIYKKLNDAKPITKEELSQTNKCYHQYLLYHGLIKSQDMDYQDIDSHIEDKLIEKGLLKYSSKSVLGEGGMINYDRLANADINQTFEIEKRYKKFETTLLNEACNPDIRSKFLMALLNNDVDLFKSVNYGEFEARPMHMMFSREVKKGNYNVLGDFLQNVCTKIDNNKSHKVREIYNCLGGKLKNDDKIKGLFTEAYKTLNSRQSSPNSSFNPGQGSGGR